MSPQRPRPAAGTPLLPDCFFQRNWRSTMNKPIKVRMRDSVMAGTLAADAFADKTIEKLTPGDSTIIGRDVERLTARLLNAHHARRHRTAAEEFVLRDRLGAAWST